MRVMILSISNYEYLIGIKQMTHETIFLEIKSLE